VALERMADAGAGVAAVVDRGATIGSLTARDIVAAYKTALSRGVRRAERLGPESALLETRIDAASPLAGRELRQVRFPTETLVLSIVRDGETLFPRAATRLEAGDQALLLTGRGHEATLRAFLARRD
jgi:trk system potassium uptake protein TrkA